MSPASRPTAASTADQSAGGTSSSVGASITSAPAARSRSDSPLAWCRVRVTKTRCPNSGRSVKKSSPGSSSDATAPTTMIAGAPSPAAVTASGSVASVPRTVRCRGRVPHCTAAAGVSGLKPLLVSSSAIAGSRPTPM